MKKVIVLLSFIFLLVGCGKKSDEIVMVTEAGFAPYEFYENGEVIGVDIEISKKIADKLGKKLVIKDVAFDSIINELNSGKADFAAAGMSINPERSEKVDFSIEYITSNQVVVVKEDSDIKSIVYIVVGLLLTIAIYTNLAGVLSHISRKFISLPVFKSILYVV